MEVATMKQRKIFAILAMVLVFVLSFGILAACNNNEDPVNYEPIDDNDIAKELEYGVDYESLYDKFGSEADASKLVFKDGLAYQTFSDGTEYELGLDYLTMAMVYNSKSDAEYVVWWKAFIQRWNYLLPEVPLYSNQYYDLFDIRVIDKASVTANPTNPYWGVASALIDWKPASSNTEKKIIIGNTTEIAGNLRYATFGTSSPAASDNDISSLINGLGTVVANKEGSYQYDENRLSKAIPTRSTQTVLVRLPLRLRTI